MSDDIKASKKLPMKVVELGLDKRVYDEMKKPSFNVEAITRQLNSEGIKITAQSIRKFIKNTKLAQRKLISRDLAAAESMKQLTIDYGKALKEILTEVEQVKNDAKANKDMQTYNQLVGKLYQGIELIAKLTGDIKPDKSVDIKIVYNEINNNVEKSMESMKNEIFKGKSIIDVDADIKKEDEIRAEEIKGE